MYNHCKIVICLKIQIKQNPILNYFICIIIQEADLIVRRSHVSELKKTPHLRATYDKFTYFRCRNFLFKKALIYILAFVPLSGKKFKTMNAAINLLKFCTVIVNVIIFVSSDYQFFYWINFVYFLLKKKITGMSMSAMGIRGLADSNLKGDPVREILICRVHNFLTNQYKFKCRTCGLRWLRWPWSEV